MQDIKVNEALWASNMLPEGVVERWFIADGASLPPAIRWPESGSKTRCTTAGLLRARHVRAGGGLKQPGKSVVRTEVLISSRRYGIVVGDALLSDGRLVRFRVLSRDPVTVRAVGGNAEPGDADAIAAWLDLQGREA